LGRVLESSPDLAKILLGGARLPAPFPRPGTGSRSKAERFVGKEFPTYFHFDKHKPDEEHKRTAELGRDLRVTFVTDAQDDYFWRTADRGYMRVLLSDGYTTDEVDGASLNLAGGLARWTGNLPEGASVGDTLTYEFEVTDPLRDTPFRNRLVVEARSPRDRPSWPAKSRKRTNEGDGPDDGEGGLSLPDVMPVSRGDTAWDEFDFDDSSALAVRRRPGGDVGSEPYDFFYNVENESLLRAQKANPVDAELTRERFRCALVLVGLALLRQQVVEKRKASQDAEPSVEDVVASTTKALAPILLPLVEFVGALSATPEA
jgi:hypothetical protein